MASTEDILKKYGRQLEGQINSYNSQSYSRDYIQFKQDMLPEVTSYKRWAETLGSVIKLKVNPKEAAKIQKQLDIAHCDVTPSQALSIALLSLLGIFLITVLGTVAIYLITDEINVLFFFLGLITSLFVFYYSYTTPSRIANAFRLKASSQMVPAILYIVVYMKHTSNLERAVEFASQHLEIPLALDFKKILWDVEIGKFPTIKQSLDSYLETWRDYSPEFVESFHLIESSLFEPSEARRIQILEKSLQVILDGVYEKMLKYARDIRTPLNNLYMLGILLPILGIALLPLASVLLGDIIKWPHVLIIFNIILPFFVFYKLSEALLKRPGGHGETSVLQLNPQYYKFTSKKAWVSAAIVALPLFLIGILPFIFQIPFITNSLGIESDYSLKALGLDLFSGIKLFDFKDVNGSLRGPFSPVSVMLSLFIPCSVALFFATAYKQKTKELIKSRSETKRLEEEFTNSLFQLGNRLGDGIPAEIAFSKVSESTQGQRTQNFFALVNQNIQQLGMSVEEAIFNTQRGAIVYYPSGLISTSMRILVESAKKGLEIAARSLMAISEYVKNIQKINERLRDLLAEIVADMKSSMTFTAPLLAGIVVGLSSMIVTILNQLQTLTQQGLGSQEVGGFGSLGSIVNIFDVTAMIPPYFIQIIIGFFLIEIIFMLTHALVTVDSGKDELQEKYELARNLQIGVMIYLVLALIATIGLTALSTIALQGIS